MQTHRTWPAFLLVVACIVQALVVAPTVAHAKDTTAKTTGPQPWCAPEFEALPGDVCHLGETKPSAARRTLVIFLHGAIAKNTTWSWNHQRGLLSLVKYHNVEAIFPRSPLTEAGYVWPGTLEAQEKVEQGLIDGWMAAKRTLEKRDNRMFDDVFIMGFSSGAYFVSSLAMRGRVDVDGYAVMAGGQSMGSRATPVERWSPVFVGVCADDGMTASHSRAFAGALTAAGIPRTVSEQHVGHGFSDVHFAHAVSYLRHANKTRVASR